MKRNYYYELVSSKIVHDPSVVVTIVEGCYEWVVVLKTENFAKFVGMSCLVYDSNDMKADFVKMVQSNYLEQFMVNKNLNINNRFGIRIIKCIRKMVWIPKKEREIYILG